MSNRDESIKLDVPKPVPYVNQLAEAHAAQEGLSREQVATMMKEQSESTFDPETATPVQHHWVDRGLKLSCEGATHPNHHIWKRH
jgi:hypothetical protein